MSRSVPEWIGKTDDTPVPPRVKLRVFERFGGICQVSGRKITASDDWDCDHTLALANGGENRESNLRPVLRSEHKKKTAQDVRQKAKDQRVRKKHLGIQRRKAVIPGSKESKFKRRVDGTVVYRDTGEPV